MLQQASIAQTTKKNHATLSNFLHARGTVNTNDLSVDPVAVL